MFMRLRWFSRGNEILFKHAVKTSNSHGQFDYDAKFPQKKPEHSLVESLFSLFFARITSESTNSILCSSMNPGFVYVQFDEIVGLLLEL